MSEEQYEWLLCIDYNEETEKGEVALIMEIDPERLNEDAYDLLREAIGTGIYVLEERLLD
ncbi:hypothetical protein JRC04_05155 [Mycolicibacterium sp. S2-37]|uniref:hypothetical protein n=1 Tax=Mycolicibacterium sp. S2-37 TaxID=2810297 RepID=UPI001A93E2EF|nr:hypothetical protein [Mycolicibacterium sp. S2-37]MBO0676845.1 hypothetical protein [Mycolicibacterium sp. S2-37]